VSKVREWFLTAERILDKALKGRDFFEGDISPFQGFGDSFIIGYRWASPIVGVFRPFRAERYSEAIFFYPKRRKG
jgi:hypothetical protein